jgi:hypothetical protein
MSTRRTWFKMYASQMLRGSTCQELEAAERWVWIGLLCLAADSPVDGVICIGDELGYSDPQLASLLHVPLRVLKSAKEKCVGAGKIEVRPGNVIAIANWKKYQSEYSRQRKYRYSADPPSQTLPQREEEIEEEREGEQKTITPSDNQKLQHEVTGNQDQKRPEFKSLPFEAQRKIFELREDLSYQKRKLERAKKHPSRMAIGGDGGAENIAHLEAKIEKIEGQIDEIFTSCT